MTRATLTPNGDGTFSLFEGKLNLNRVKLQPVGEALETCEDMSVPDWAEANAKLTDTGRSESLRLYGYQRAIVDAMSDPNVQVRFLTPAEMRRMSGPSGSDFLLLLMALDAGKDIVVWERADSGDPP